ncbi:nucleotidyltransferase family protein [Duganella radicis]|uniref:nucleotidyltransferase family protein n=1 Tax=Duganella radicis TaxID=551988 RepID=UPI001478982B|nr:nucleotidyltransferase domain-containing protein [Duganella radicis]
MNEREIAKYLASKLTGFQKICSKHGATITIYGSFATGRATLNSDIDFLLQTVNPGSLDNLKRDLELLFERKIDIAENGKLIKILRERIISEATEIETLANGRFQPARPKSNKFYELLIWKQAGAIVWISPATDLGPARILTGAARILYFWRSHLSCESSSRKRALVNSIRKIELLYKAYARRSIGAKQSAYGIHKLCRRISRMDGALASEAEVLMDLT